MSKKSQAERPVTGRIRLRSWDDFAKVMKAMKAGKWIYRGHENAKWKLKSTLDRHVEELLSVHKDWSKAAFDLNLPRAEFFAITKFREIAKKFQPIDSDAAALIAMQHYGADTRLLDFSMSIMVALFFAYEKRATGRKRAIYAINYDSLMNNANVWGGYQSFLERMAAEESGKSGFDRETERVWWNLGPQIENHYLQLFTLEEASSNIWACNSASAKGVIPLYKAAYNGRQMAQVGIELMPRTFEGFAKNLAAVWGISDEEVNEPKSVITNKVSNVVDLETVLPSALVKFIFDADMEDGAWQILDQANINAATIYPDIEGVAKSVRYNESIILGPMIAKDTPMGKWESFENSIRQKFPQWDGCTPLKFLEDMKLDGVDFKRLAALDMVWNSEKRQSALGRTVPMATDETDVQFLENVISRIKGLATIAKVMIPMNKVETCSMESSISLIVDKMLENSYSHIPVLDPDGRVVGVFSESTLLEINKVGICDTVPTTMRDIVDFLPTEKHKADVFRFVPRNDAVLHLRQLCEEALNRGERIGMFFVTENGGEDEPLCGILTVWDIASVADLS